MSNNPHKTVCANSNGIITSFRDSNKHKFIAYDRTALTDVQLYGPQKPYRVQNPGRLNPVQQKLYAEHLYGLNYFTEEEVAKMPNKRRFQIMHAYKKVQRVLNLWKQEIAGKRADAFLRYLCPNSPITKTFLAVQGTDPELLDTHSFKDLGITQHMIAEKLVDSRLLPANFFELS